MNGYIPDSRTVLFDMWRDYEDIRVSDISYYVRLNHSRLIVAKLLWRPELRQEVEFKIREAIVGMYNDSIEHAEYWKQHVRQETIDAISDIWMDAREVAQYFLDDVR